jgi:hypothetical protein
MRQFLESDAWKVLLFGVAAPYELWRDAEIHCGDGGPNVEKDGGFLGRHIKHQLADLRIALREDLDVPNFAILGFVVVYDSPVDFAGTECSPPAPNSTRECIVQHTVFTRAQLKGAQWHGVGAGDLEESFAKLCRRVMAQEDYYEYQTDYRRSYWASELLGFASWYPPICRATRPQPSPPRSPPTGATGSRSLAALPGAEPAPEPRSAPAATPITHSVMCHDYWQVKFGPIASYDAAVPTIMCDSTMLDYGQPGSDVRYRGELVGRIVGKYGDSFDGGLLTAADPSGALMSSLRARSTDLNPNAHFFACVPAADCHPRHEFPDHALWQRVQLGRILTTPTLRSLMDLCYNEVDTQLFKAKGVHLTAPGRNRLVMWLLSWAREHGALLVICAGWNSSTPDQEYSRQLQFLQACGMT